MSLAANDATTTNDTYLYVTKHNGQPQTRGQQRARFGHQIDSYSHDVTEGIFAEWCWDGRQLVVNNDRYGIFPLFWFQPPGGGVCLSPSLLKLVQLGAPVDLDTDALAVFFRLGCFVGDDTPFAAIKMIPPNAVFEWENGKLQCHGRYPETPKPSTISRDEAIDRYIDLFAKAMGKRRPESGKFAVPITGGRDSRHILLELHRTGIEPTVCVSALDNPPDPNLDAKIGKLLCGEIGFKHVIVDQQLSLRAAEIRKNRETHFCAPAHGWCLALADFLNERFDYIYDGLGGDVMSQSSFLSSNLDATFRSGNANAISAELLFGQAPARPVLKGIVNRKLQNSIAPEIAQRRLAKEVENHLDRPNPVASFFFWNRTRRMTALAPYGILTRSLHAYTPFLDHDLFDFMNTLPSSLLLDRGFHDDAIARAYPGFMHIPYANPRRNARPFDNRRIQTRFLNETTRRLMRRQRGPLMSNISSRAKLITGIILRGRIHPRLLSRMIYLDQIESLLVSSPDIRNKH